MIKRFNDRREGGRALAAMLSVYKDRNDTIVLALPRGGVPVGFEVAKALNAPLEVFLVRKLGVPGQEELAFGAIASGGITVLNEALVHALNLSNSSVEKIIEKEVKELERREKLYRSERGRPGLEGKVVIIVDDGLATGATMRAAVTAVKALNPRLTIVAAPVASRDTCDDFNRQADQVCVCSINPEPFYGVGMWYRNFEQTTDGEVIELLERSRIFGGKNAIAA
jgi:putative phosphoribosyl transferase